MASIARKEPGFTQGPWRVGYHGPSLPIIITADPHWPLLSVGLLQGGVGVSYANEDADAHLIAAAPEMYEELAAAETDLRAWAREMGWGPKSEAIKTADRIARVLAKARGEVQS